MPVGNNAWRVAHPGIAVTDEGLSALKGDFPSLEAQDFSVYYEAKGDKETANFVRRLSREIVWAYDGWAKALRDSNANALMADVINGASMPEYAQVKRYLLDYCKANNLDPMGLGSTDVEHPDYARLAADVGVDGKLTFAGKKK